jgi:polyisoprenoid-binding protein YceI
MVSVWHFNVANLRAKFPGVKGSLDVNAEDPFRSRFRVEIEGTSVTTGHPAQEDFMRSEPGLTWSGSLSSRSRARPSSLGPLATQSKAN